MDKAEAVRIIETLFPPDSRYPETRATGRELLLEAIASTWEHLPLPTLRHLARLNLERELRNAKA